MRVVPIPTKSHDKMNLKHFSFQSKDKIKNSNLTSYRCQWEYHPFTGPVPIHTAVQHSLHAFGARAAGGRPEFSAVSKSGRHWTHNCCR